MHVELVSYSATAPGAGGAAAAALSGDSLVFKNARGPGRVIAWWADNQTAGFHQLSFPSGHDTTRGLRVRVRASEVDPLLPIGVGFYVQPQETISALIAGSATAGDVESGSMLVAYDDLPGTSQRNIGWQDLQRRMEKLTSVDMAITGAAAGYTGGAAINSVSDLLLANRDYALIGGTIGAETATVWVAGPDLGNLKVGFPANETDDELGLNFFSQLARAFDLNCIPVINSGNKASTTVGILQDENNITPTVTLLLALLKA